MKRREHIVIQLLLSATIFVAAALALDITPVGTIDDDLFAPTSLCVQDDELAVLEPFAQQLKIFSADGVLDHEVALTGDAYGLTKISQYVYLYCDRDRRAVVAINAINGAQYDYFAQAPDMVEPVDLLRKDSSICVLDAGSATIYVFSSLGNSWQKVTLARSADDPTRYFNSFAYDAERARFYLFDQLNAQVLVVDSEGKTVNIFGGFGGRPGQITRGGEIALDQAGRVYVTDRFQGKVAVYDAEGTFLGDLDVFAGAVAVPTGMAIDASGVLYVASTMGHGIQMFFVALSPAQDEKARIVQRYPENNAVLSVEEIKLAALAELDAVSGAVTGFDFELYTDTLESPLTVADRLAPVADTIRADSIRSWSAEWTPATEFDSEEVYHWRLRLRTEAGEAEWSDFRLFRTLAVPLNYQLEQNYPNPFNPVTTISFTLPSDIDVTLEVINLLGQQVTTLVDQELPSGGHTVTWDGTNGTGQAVATGVYFYRLRTENYVRTRKMVMIK